MALTRSISRLDLAPVPQTVSEVVERGPLLALSQRKLNALGTPIAYIDRNQRYRFVNKALLDWFCKRADEVLGREIIEVLGRENYQLYRAYIDAALGGERVAFATVLPAAAIAGQGEGRAVHEARDREAGSDRRSRAGVDSPAARGPGPGGTQAQLGRQWRHHRCDLL